MSFHCNDWWISPTAGCDVHKDGSHVFLHNLTTSTAPTLVTTNAATLHSFFPVLRYLQDGNKERSSPERNVQELHDLFWSNKRPSLCQCFEGSWYRTINLAAFWRPHVLNHLIVGKYQKPLSLSQHDVQGVHMIWNVLVFNFEGNLQRGLCSFILGIFDSLHPCSWRHAYWIELRLLFLEFFVVFLCFYICIKF